MALVLAVITFLVYGASLQSGFVYDARIEILREGFVTSLSNLPAVLSLKVLGMNLMLAGRPGQLLFLMLNAALWGKDPWGYHLSSDLLHAGNVALLFLLLSRLVAEDLTGLDWRGLGKAQLAAVVATLVFALHPVAAEPVAAVSYSSDLLVAFFTLLALLAATAFRPEHIVSATLMGTLCVFCAFAAVTCKESGAAIPPILCVYWFLFRRHEAKGPWIVVVSAATVLAAAFLSARFLFAPSPASPNALRYLGGSFSQVLLIQPRLWVFMLGKLIWPVRLSADYRLEDVGDLSAPMAIVILCLVIVLQGWLATRSRLGALGVALYWLGLVTVSNLIPLYRPVADRFYYLPLAGLSMQILAGLVMTLGSHRGYWVATGSLLVALLPLTRLTLSREQVFFSEVALWRNAIELNPADEIAHNNLGEALIEARQVDEASSEFERALEINSDDDNAHNNLGKALLEKGQIDQAMAEFRKALEINPSNANAHINLGLVQETRGDLNDALANFQRFAELAPFAAETDYARLWIWLIRVQLNEKAEADRELEFSLSKGWNASPQAWVSRNAAFLLNHVDEADYLAEAASTDPESIRNQSCEAWYYAGMKRLLANDQPTAIAYFQKCLATQKVDFGEYQLAQAELKATAASK